MVIHSPNSLAISDYAVLIMHRCMVSLQERDTEICQALHLVLFAVLNQLCYILN